MAKILPLAVGVAVLGLLSALFWQNRTLHKRLDYLATELRQGGPSKTGHSEDPYRARAVKNTIVKNSPGMRQCFNTFVGRGSAKSEGAVKLDWRIEPSGKAVHPEIVSADLGDAEFKNCLVQTVASWQFPRPPLDEEYYVEHTFNFRKER